MVFTKKSVSKYGTAYYSRGGFKQTIAIPSSHFVDGVAPETVEVGGDGVNFAVKAPKAQGLEKTLKALTPEERKQVRAAARKATADAVAALKPAEPAAEL